MLMFVSFKSKLIASCLSDTGMRWSHLVASMRWSHLVASNA